MADTKYQQDTCRFDCLGLDLNRPVDSIKEKKFPKLINVRSYQAGRIEPRDGLTDTGTLPDPDVHSCRRLNDPNTGEWLRVVGAGSKLAVGQGPYTQIDDGYSGNPLALVPYRTDQSPTGFMYIGDAHRMRKTCISGSLQTVGLSPPVDPPSTLIDQPLYKIVNYLTAIGGLGIIAGGPGVWNADGTNRPSIPVPGDRATSDLNPNFLEGTTIQAILYDTGSTGWALVRPVVTDGLGKGEMFIFNRGGANQEYSVAHAVFPGAATGSPPVAVSNILQDGDGGGPGGGASLQLAAPLHLIAGNCMLYNMTQSVYFRAIGVIGGPDKTTSLRILNGTPCAIGDQIQTVPSFRCYLVNTHAVGESLHSPSIGATFQKGLGTLVFVIPPTPQFTQGTIDLTTIGTDPAPTSEGNRAVMNEDFMHLALLINHPELVTEIQCHIDVTQEPANLEVLALLDKPLNYYYRAFRGSDLTPNLSGSDSILTTAGTVIQHQQLNNPQAPNVISQQMPPGNNQWGDLTFRISDLLRVGSDATRTMQTVGVLRFVVIANASNAANNDPLRIYFNSWWIGGSYNPDTFDTSADNYQYRYRARVFSTGAKSNWSPATTGATDPERMQVEVNLEQYQPPAGTTLTTADFVLDVQRFGGTLDQWRYAGTVSNTANPVLTDNYADDTIAVLPTEGQDSWQPWPIEGLPIEGRASSVSGITVIADPAGGNVFDMRWAPSTVIRINQIPYTIYRMVSTTEMQLVQSANAQFNVDWRIDKPIFQGQPLACLWGDESIGALFACGDRINPGRLYYTNMNDPDTTTDVSWLDVTSPSEPLMNGIAYNMRSYLFSSERMFQVLPTGDANAPWTTQEIPNGKGLFARWAINRTPAPIICFLTKDGISATTGGAPLALTDADMNEYFPTEGNPGTTVNGLAPPDISAGTEPNLRLDYYDEYLYFDCIDIKKQRITLVLAFDLGAMVRGEAPGGWFYDLYKGVSGVTFHYGEEGQGVHSLLCGAANGHLYQYTENTADAGQSFDCVVRTASRDEGDPRSNKLYGDIMLDTDTHGVDLHCTVGYNNYQILEPPVTVDTDDRGREQVAIKAGTDNPVSLSEWTEGRNIALEIDWTITGAARPFLFIWEPRFTFSSAPIRAASWSMSPSSLGLENWKHIRLVRIAHVSHAPVILEIMTDGFNWEPITIPASGGRYRQDIFPVPVHKFKLIQATVEGADGSEFNLDSRDSYFDIKEWGSDGEYRGFRLFGDFSMVEG